MAVRAGVPELADHSGGKLHWGNVAGVLQGVPNRKGAGNVWGFRVGRNFSPVQAG